FAGLPNLLGGVGKSVLDVGACLRSLGEEVIAVVVVSARSCFADEVSAMQHALRLRRMPRDVALIVLIGFRGTHCGHATWLRCVSSCPSPACAGEQAGGVFQIECEGRKRATAPIRCASEKTHTPFFFAASAAKHQMLPARRLSYRPCF